MITVDRIELGQSLKSWQENNAEHLRYDYDLSENDIVIDLGAYFGEWSQTMYERFKCKIVAVEPTEYIWSRGVFKDGTIINKAAATYNGKMSFGGRAYYTSAYESNDHEYDCFDVTELLKLYDEIAVMKVNIEGAEYKLLEYIIENGLIDRIKNLQVQFHMIKDRPYEKWYQKLSDSLSETHKLTWQYKYCWENWERLN